jgi:diacylglycerol kinase family enzyme
MTERSPNDMVVLLNENAKRVTKRVKESLSQVMPSMQLFYSRTLDEAKQQVRQAMDMGAKRIVCGGGDGTIVHTLNQIKEYIDEQNARFQHYLDQTNAQIQTIGTQVRERFDKIEWPKIGLVKLGTGNGWSGFIGSKKPVAEIMTLSENKDHPTTSFHLVEGENRVFHFSGLGYDAAVLNDYYIFKNRFDRGILKPWFKTILGYLTSMTFKTIPEQFFRRDVPQVRVVNRSGDIFAVSHSQGLRQVASKAGEVIYEGPCNIIGAATTPEYGYGLRAFPFALMKTGFFNFRIVTASVLELVTHAPAIFRGHYESPTFIDFLAQNVHLEFDREMPFQIGGDPQGFRKEVDYRISDICVDVYNFRPQAA